MEKRALEEEVKTEATWFGSLDCYEQFDILVKLLKITSGELINRFFIHAKKLQEQKKKRRSFQGETTKYQEQHHLTIGSVCNIGFKVPDDDKNPLAQNVENKAKILNDAFTKYVYDVLGSTEKSKEKTHKKGKKGSKASSKSSKGTKSSKSSRSKGRKGKVEDVIIDQVRACIQSLRIFQ